jgi:hypothetical protein
VHLRRGFYIVNARGVDTRGRRETIVRPTNSKGFRIR